MIAVVGMVLLMVFTFLGYSYKSGGELGFSILISAGITAFTAFLLWLMIKAKGAENNLDKWKFVEVGAVLVYLAFAGYMAISGEIMHFFVVNNNKDHVKNSAKSDLDKIDQLFSEYIEYETQAIEMTRTGLLNSVQRRQVRDESLKEFMSENNIEPNNDAVNVFVDMQEYSLIGVGFQKYHENYKVIRQNIENVVDGWSVMQIPLKAAGIDDLAKQTERYLSSLSDGATLPVVVSDSQTKKYTITADDQARTFVVNGGIESFTFKKSINEAEGYSTMAIALVVIIHLLILFNYIVAYRTNIVRVGKDLEEDGGIIL